MLETDAKSAAEAVEGRQVGAESSAGSDPSMEEILASIQNIVAGNAPETPDAPPSSESVSVPASSGNRDAGGAESSAETATVFDLTPTMARRVAMKDDADRNFERSVASDAGAGATGVEILEQLAEGAGGDEADFSLPDDGDAAIDSNPAEALLAESQRYALDCQVAPPPPKDAQVEAPNHETALDEPEPPREDPGKPRETIDLVGEETRRDVGSALGSLARVVLQKNAQTLDEVVMQLLRPMLKDWLDKNLATIVQRAVEAEIQRITGEKGP